jgi:signal transduction histidine kinase
LEDVQHELDRVRAEIERLRAAQARLVVAADDDRRAIERDLHEGVHQHLVALATTLQLARLAAGSDPSAVEALLEEIHRDVRHALDETALLAQRLYPSMIGLTGLAALLRSAALNAGVPATVDVDSRSNYPPEVGMTVYLCWLVLLARESSESRATIEVREHENALTFELVGEAPASEADFERMRDRVEALGGRLTIDRERGTRLSGSLPLPR